MLRCRLVPFAASLAAGLILVLSACETPISGNGPAPDVSSSPSGEPADLQPDPTPSTGDVKPIIIF